MPCCCVSLCKNRSEKKKKGKDGITFHLFPRDPLKRKKWINSVGRKNWKPSNVTVICSKHFTKNCFYKTKNGLMRIFDDAVPQVDIPSKCDQDSPESSTDQPLDTSHQMIEKTETQITTHRTSNRSLANLPILKMPVLDDDDPPKTRLLASNVRRLLFMCKKQRKSIRKLQQILRIQELRIQRLEYPMIGLVEGEQLEIDFDETENQEGIANEQETEIVVQDTYWD